MLTPTGKHLRIVITILVLGLAFSILYGEAGRDAQAATTTLPARSVICVSDVNFNGFIDRPEAVDGVTSYLVEIPLPGLGRPLTRPEAVELVTYYLLNLNFECESPDDPLAHWPLEENPSATTTADATGNGHTGQVTDVVSVPGATGRAFEFNGSTSIVIVPDSGFDGVDELTVQAWVYPTGDHNEVVVSKWGPGGGSDDSWMLQLQTGGVLFVVSGFDVPGAGENSDAFTTEKLPLNTWTRVTGVYKNGEFIRLYLNGVLKADEVAKDGPVPDNSQSLTIGAQHLGAAYFKGCIDEIKVWSQALVPSAVTLPTTGCQAAEVETFTLGGQPNDITFDGQYIWVTNAPAGQVSKLDLNGNILLSIPVGQTPQGIDSDGEFVWVSDWNDSKLRKLNPNTGAVECDVTIASSLNGVLFDGRDIWVANPVNNAVNKVSTSCEMLGQFTVSGNPGGLAFDGQNIWATGWTSNKVTKLDGFDGSNKGEFDVASKTNNAVFDGRHIWVAKDPSDTVTKLLASDGQKIGDFAIGSRSYGIASDSVFVFVGNYDDGTVSKLSVRDGSLLNTFTVGSMPNAVAIDGRNVWVANRGDGTVSKINDAADGFDVEDQLGPPKPTISYEQWTRKADMPTARVRLGAALDRNGQIFAIDGHSGTSDLSTVEVYDPIGDVWTSGTSTPLARSGNGSATGGYGKVYSIGGSTNNGVSSIGLVESYDPTTGSWSNDASLDSNRYALDVVAASNGRIYAIGGVPGSNQQGVTSNEEYNPATDTWTARAPMPTGRWGVGLAATPDGLIYAIGGNRDGCPCQLDTVEVYDTFTDQWTTLPPMPTARGNVRAVQGADGKIYAMGGSPSGSPGVATVEVFDPVANTWSHSVDMPVARGAFEAVVAPNGRVYIFGGNEGGTEWKSVYEFGPKPPASRIVFYSWEHGNADVYSMNPDGTDRQRLTDATTCEVHPRTSPDGTMIAYYRAPCGNQPSEIVVMNATGTELASWQTTIGDRTEDPAWSPDGERLAYRCGGTQVCLRDWQGNTSSELLIDAASNGKDAVTRFEWSPDGMYILLSWAAPGGNWGIGRINVAAKTAEEFIPHGNPGMVFDARYSLDGTSVVFSRESGGLSTGDIRIADSEGQNERPLETGITGAHATDWSADGRIYFYSGESTDSAEIYSILPDGTGLRRLTNNDFGDQYPDTWAPSDLLIVFSSDRDGNFEIYLMSEDGVYQRRVTDNSTTDRNPVFSPGGSKIAFVSERDGNEEIYVMNPDGSDQTRLTVNSGANNYPHWSPDGTQIAFSSVQDDVWNIWLMNADGSDKRQLTSGDGENQMPSWSPHGNRIAFASNRDGDWEIFTVNADGSGLIQVTSNTDFDIYPRWSPDGAEITFYSRRDGNLEVYVTNTDGSIQTNITKHPDDDLSPAWSTDGRRIVFSSDRDSNQGTEIYVMDADGTNQTRLTSVAGFDVSPHWQLAQQPAPVTPEMRLAIRSDRSGDKEIYEIDLVGNIIRRLTDSPGEDGSPAYSPDGTRIAFYSNRNGPDFEIFVMNHDLSGLRQLTFDNVDDLSLTWCGNDRIAYMYDYNQIYIMNADGSDSRLLIGGQAPSCTSDGAALLVNQSGTIVKVDPQTGVGESLGSGGAAVWSPDGTQIALDDGKHLFVMDVASRVITQITDGPATDSNPQWAPGPAIVFTSDRPGNSEVYIINPDGSGLRNITRNAASDSQATWWVPPTQDIGGFAPAVNYPAGMSASAIKTGDVDGDGDLDVLTSNQVSGDITVLYNNGQGVLGIANAFDLGGTVVGITTPSDLDSDGDLDVVAALAPPDEMAVVLNDGSGNFSVTSTNSYGPATKSIADGDFDGDGDLDVAVPQESQGFRVFLNNGDGSFTSYGHMSASSGLPYQLAVGDLDGDLDLDIVGAINQFNKIEVFLNDGSGTFSSVSTYSTQTWPRGIVSIDIDMDGDLDVAVVNMTSNSVSVFMNDGSANLGDPKHYPTELEPRAIASGDFNQDGYPDLAVVNIISNSVSVFINRGDGTFEAPFNIGVGDGPNTIAVADLDGDTWPDIVTGNSDDVSVILNRGRGLRYIGAFEELAGRDLNHLHPSGQGVRVGNSYYVVSGESESLGVFTPQIERTRILGNGEITPWEVVGSLPSSRSQAIVTATDDNIYVLGDHPGVTSVLRIPILPDGALGSPVDDRPMLTGRNAGAAIIHEGNLYVIGGANNSLSPPNLKSVERAAVNSDGSLGEWQTAPSLNVARSQSAIVKTSRYIWAIGGGAESGKAGTIERARLLAGGDIGPWEIVAVEVDPSSSARALLVGSCIFYIGGSSTTGASNRVDCLLLDRNEDITNVVSMNGLTVPRYEPNVFSDDGYLFVTGGAQFEPGPGLKGWKVTERASLAPSP